MKRFFVVLSIISLLFFISASSCGESAFAGFFEKINFVNKTSVKIYEKIIKHELKDEFDTDFNVKLDIYNLSDLKKGIFKSLDVSSDKLFYKGLSISDFYARTINENNKIVYKNKRVYYPCEMPLSFSASITNEDLDMIVKSELFAKKIEKLNEKYGGFFTLEIPNVNLKEDKIYFDVPFKTFFSRKPVFVHFNSGIEVNDNEILLKNITFTSRSNVLDMKALSGIASRLNPVKLKKDALKNKFCNIIIKTANINNGIISVNGNLIINQNYWSNNE